MEATVDNNSNMHRLHLKEVQMGSERQCGLGSLLPMSCRGRAEAFARRLHTRLRRLGAEPGGVSAHEATWLNHHGAPSANAAADSDVYFDFDMELESPSSPVDEIPEPSMAPSSSAPESGCVLSSPVDNESPPSNSDSDATYYDLDNDPDAPPKSGAHFKYHRSHDDTHISKNLNKLKLISTPASEILDHLLQNKSITPERQSPIRTQPLARENGYADYGSLEKRTNGSPSTSNTLYSAINFEDCKRRNSQDDEDDTTLTVDEVDHLVTPTEYCNGVASPKEDEEEDITKSATFEDESELDLTTECAVQEESSDDVCEEQLLHDDAPQEVVTVDSPIVLEITEVGATDPDATDILLDDENDDRPQRVRRCSSLRTGKTPPGTPGRKKIVRFADVLGLDLADVKTFMDDIPNIPRSAFEDLRDADLSSSPATDAFSVASHKPPSFDRRLVPLFQQPGDQPNFLDTLNARSVCLENAVVQEGATIAIYGTVKVRNLDFNKSVQIRYSLDGWKSFSDLQATYVPNSCDGFSDRFQFLLYAHTLTPGQKLEFAVRFMCKGCQYWDNNQGTNYSFQCISSNSQNANFYSSMPQPLSPIHSWDASFY